MRDAIEIQYIHILSFFMLIYSTDTTFGYFLHFEFTGPLNLPTSPVVGTCTCVLLFLQLKKIRRERRGI